MWNANRPSRCAGMSASAELLYYCALAICAILIWDFCLFICLPNATVVSEWLYMSSDFFHRQFF